MIRNSILIILAIVLIVTSLLITLIFLAPNNFPQDRIVTIKKGDSLISVAQELKNQNIIKSEFWFKSFAVMLGGTKGIKAGDYQLGQPENVYSLASRITSGDYRLKSVRVTIPEGLNNIEISELLKKKLISFDVNLFLKSSSSSEGYLFPDTYEFLPNSETAEVIKEIKENFDDKIKSLDSEIKRTGKSLSDIIKMASILELEARTDETRRIVAGILWKRLALGMPLQVDSSFKYINGKGTKDLTLADLKLNSPYNSYTNKGLPPTPISNPGLASIKAALTPIKTNYLYFLTDDQGNMHYAENYQKHLQNKSLYLK